MCRPNIIFVLVLLVAVILSCGEDKDEDNSIVGGDGKAGFSGITEVDEGMNFKSIDPDDWRDDGILTDCLVYPNPARAHPLDGRNQPTLRLRLLSDAHIASIIRNSNGAAVPRTNKWSDGSFGKNFTFDYGHRMAGAYEHDLDLVVFHESRIDFIMGRQVVVDDIRRLGAGMYRLFIYASESELMMKMLQDTGTTNAPREKYSLVYGDVLIIE